MTKPTQIAFFNHKGGVSKTTSAFHIAWKLAEKGKRVMLADFDPQCNLTGLVLQYNHRGSYPFETLPGTPPKNIRDALEPAFSARPKQIEPVEIVAVSGCPNLYIAPGHVGMAEYESMLAISHELTNSLSTLQNIPGSLRWTMDITAEENNIDIVIVDMSPSLGAINQNLFTTSDGFIVPMAPDFFSSMAVESLSRILPKWNAWAKRAAAQEILINSAYPWPNITPKYIGSIVQNYRKRGRDGKEAKPTRSYQKWFDDLYSTKIETLFPSLRKERMLFLDSVYAKANAPIKDFLMEVPDFNSLIAISQDKSKPVFSLTRDDLQNTGVVAEVQMASVQSFNQIYSVGADKVLSILSEM